MIDMYTLRETDILFAKRKVQLTREIAADTPTRQFGHRLHNVFYLCKLKENSARERERLHSKIHLSAYYPFDKKKALVIIHMHNKQR